MNEAIYKINLNYLTPLFKFPMDYGADPFQLLYVLKPKTPSEEDRSTHEIIGLINPSTKLYHIPSAKCPQCGPVTEVIIKIEGNNPVTCNTCGAVCCESVFQAPSSRVLSKILFQINPEKYPPTLFEKPTFKSWLRKIIGLFREKSSP